MAPGAYRAGRGGRLWKLIEKNRNRQLISKIKIVTQYLNCDLEILQSPIPMRRASRAAADGSVAAGGSGRRGAGHRGRLSPLAPLDTVAATEHRGPKGPFTNYVTRFKCDALFWF